MHAELRYVTLQAAKGVGNTFSIGRPDEKLPHKI